jgi:Fur family ferric uptake transcriptional regulator
VAALGGQRLTAALRRHLDGPRGERVSRPVAPAEEPPAARYDRGVSSTAVSASGSGWAQHASERLGAAGYRRGGARQAVIELLSVQSCALSAFEIEDAMRGGERPASRASVYRILDELERLKLVSKIEVGQGIVRYEPVHPGGDHHHHLVCDGCGEVTPFADADLERAIARVGRRVAFEVVEHDVVLHGACRACRG